MKKTVKELQKIAENWDTLSEFIEYDRKHYQQSLRSGHHAEIVKNLKRKNGLEKRRVYVLVSIETQQIYVGLTHFEDVSLRKHVREPMRTMRKNGTITAVTELLSPNAAVEAERFWIKRARQSEIDYPDGMVCVNKDNGGGLGQVMPKKYGFAGEIMTIREWAEFSGVPFGTLRSRMYAGDSLEDAMRPVHTPLKITYRGITDTVTGWAKESGISASKIRWRAKAGWIPCDILEKNIFNQNL